MWGDANGAAGLNHPLQITMTHSTTASTNTNDAKTTGADAANHGKVAGSGAGNVMTKNKNTKASSKCKASLVQISSPSHIPLHDARWQELFLSYEILVHLDRDHNYTLIHNGASDQDVSLMSKVCQNMAKHAVLSSNLAGFAWHLTRMIRELIHSCIQLNNIDINPDRNGQTGADNGADVGSDTVDDGTESGKGTASPSPSASDFMGKTSFKIALVGKARVVCGAMNLYRIFIHEALAHAKNFENAKEYFYFQRREGNATSSAVGNHETSSADGDMLHGLLDSILAFISLSESGGSGAEKEKAMRRLVYDTPELYDAVVFAMDLLLVLSSTQLYQPIVSSYQRVNCYDDSDVKNDVNSKENDSTTYGKHLVLDWIMKEAHKKHRQGNHNRNKTKSKNKNKSLSTQSLPSSAPSWSSQSILVACLNWMINRPPPPERSIAHHVKEMAQIIAQEVKNEKMGLDGMYENHAVVMACSPSHVEKLKSKLQRERAKGRDENRNSSDDEDDGGNGKHSSALEQSKLQWNSSGVIMDSTKRVIHLSSSLLLLPIRLLLVALRVLGQSQQYLGGGKGSAEDSKLAQLQALYGNRSIAGDTSSPSPTNDVLWLSDSPLADLGHSLFLVLANNHRAGVLVDQRTEDFVNNPFRVELASMDDNRWEGFTPTSSEDVGDAMDIFENIDLSNGNEAKSEEGALRQYRDTKQSNLLTTNFEHLFDSFAGTLHTEIGALALYTLLQASPIFSASLAVRSDLDKLVLPLLRTLYHSSSTTHYISGRTTTTSSNPSGVNVIEEPFRSRSQLYVIMILLLIFSQDASFGPDSFRRSNIASVQWYKERKLKDLSLGSLLTLSLLRSITYNLNRMQDPFLLSNCCAVLLNLSPHAVDMHSYAAMRLVTVLIATMKRYTLLVMKNAGKPAEEGDVSTTLGMFAEACRVLLQVVKHAVRRKVVEKNLHLVYALVYNQREFNIILKAKCSPFRAADTEKIRAVILEADKLIQQVPNRNAEKSMEALRNNSHVLKGLKVSNGRTRLRSDSSVDSTISDSTMNGMEDFKFTYEEEADPETFFIPYLWEVIVSTVTASSLEWDRMHIKVFAILHHVADTGNGPEHTEHASTHEFSKDVDNVV